MGGGIGVRRGGMEARGWFGGTRVEEGGGLCSCIRFFFFFSFFFFFFQAEDGIRDRFT